MDLNAIFQNVSTQGLGVVIAIIFVVSAIWLVRLLQARIDKKDDQIQKQNNNLVILNVNTTKAINNNNALIEVLTDTLKKNK